MTIDGATGRVGINETAPTGRLHIDGISSNNSLSMLILEGGWPGMVWRDTETNQDSMVAYIDGDNFYIRGLPYANRDDANPQTNSTNRFTLELDTGNVGIGTASPQNLLDVHGNIQIGTNNNFLYGNLVAATNVAMIGTNASDVLQIGQSSGFAGIKFYPGAALVLDIQSDGDIVHTPGTAGKGFVVRESDDGNNAFEVLSYTAGSVLQMRQGGTGVLGFDSTAAGFGFINLDAGFTVGSTTAPETDLMVENDVWIGGDDANANRSGGENAAAHNLAIQNTSTTSVFFRVKDSGVTGYTTIDSGADDIFAINKNNSGGGLTQYWIGGDTADATMNEILAMGGTASTTHSTAGRALFEISVFEISAGSTAAITSDGNVFGIRDAGGTLLLLDEDGNMWTDDTITTMDFEAPGVERDDIALISAMDYLGNPAGVIQSDWENFTRYNEEDLIAAGIRGDTIANGGMLNHTKMFQLHNGGIRQLERKKADRVDLDATNLELARTKEKLELAEATAVEQRELLLDAHELIERLSHQLESGK